MRLFRGCGSFGGTISHVAAGMLSIGLVISACGPAAPQQTPRSSATSSPSPASAFSAMPAAGADDLAASSDLHVWIDDYVKAYGGKVTVGGADKDASQLLAAVQADATGFVQKQVIKGTEESFFVVNGVPLAIQDHGKWRAILARDISDAKGAQFALPVLWYQIYDAGFASAIRNANVLTITRDLDTGFVFQKLTTQDWKKLLGHWETIKAELDAGQIPNDIPYDWSVDQVIDFARKNNMAVRAQHLVWNGDVPDSIRNAGFTKAELLKLLEFTVSVKVIKYKGVISEWNAADELVVSEFSTDRWGFWQQNVGLLDATRLSAGIVRRIDPAATITFADDHQLEGNLNKDEPTMGTRLLKYVKILKAEKLIDKVDIENNLWVYDPPDEQYMEQYLRLIQAEGVGLAAPEITVCPTKNYTALPRKAYAVVDDPLRAHAELHRRAVDAYLKVGAYDIGLGDVGDATSTANYLDPGSNMALFDAQWKPKMGWYEVLAVMYAAFFTRV